MTKEEIINRMKEIEEHRFELAMINVWKRETFIKDFELRNEWFRLKEELEKK